MPVPKPSHKPSHSQILVPTVIEEGNRGDRAFDIYSQLLRERIVFLGQEVDDQVANLIISQILFLEAHDTEKDIHLYINSPGGVAYAGMAIYDVMQHVAPDVSTICVGMGMSAAAMIRRHPRGSLGYGDSAAGGPGSDPTHVRDNRASQWSSGRAGGARHRS